MSADAPLPTDLQATTQSFGARKGTVNPAASSKASIFARKTLASALWLNRSGEPGRVAYRRRAGYLKR